MDTRCPTCWEAIDYCTCEETTPWNTPEGSEDEEQQPPKEARVWQENNTEGVGLSFDIPERSEGMSQERDPPDDEERRRPRHSAS